MSDTRCTCLPRGLASFKDRRSCDGRTPALIWIKRRRMLGEKATHQRTMTDLRIKAGPHEFEAKFERQLAPKTCAKFESLLPFKSRIIHVRWSGEGCWIPLGDLDLDLGYENATSFPAPGDIIIHPGGISETEILLAYGGVRFDSKVGQLAGNHFLTITKGRENLSALGKLTLWHGVQDILFERA
jgi:hypothetical protein